MEAPWTKSNGNDKPEKCATNFRNNGYDITVWKTEMRNYKFRGKWIA